MKSFLCLLLLSVSMLVFAQEPDAEKVHVRVAESASFPGGTQGLATYLEENCQYPDVAAKLGIEGRVFVKFIIEKDGSLSDIRIVKGLGGGCDREALRLVMSMPKWKPGRNANGDTVRQLFIQNILFEKPNRTTEKKSG